MLRNYTLTLTCLCLVSPSRAVRKRKEKRKQNQQHLKREGRKKKESSQGGSSLTGGTRTALVIRGERAMKKGGQWWSNLVASSRFFSECSSLKTYTFCMCFVKLTNYQALSCIGTQSSCSATVLCSPAQCLSSTEAEVPWVLNNQIIPQR